MQLQMCKWNSLVSFFILKSDSHLISPYSTIPEWHTKVMRITEMINNHRSSGSLNKFSLSGPLGYPDRVNCSNIAWIFATFKGRPPRVRKTCWIRKRVHCLICVSFRGGGNSCMLSGFPMSCQVTRNLQSRTEIVTKRAVSKWWYVQFTIYNVQFFTTGKSSFNLNMQLRMCKWSSLVSFFTLKSD